MDENEVLGRLTVERERLAAARRVIALYVHTLSVIACHPGGDEVAEWMKGKALEALEKTRASELGERRLRALLDDEPSGGVR